MKKVIIILMFCIFCVLLSSCYYDTKKRDMELIEVKVYDKDNNEVTGEYKNYFTITTTDTLFKVSNDLKKVNSAAPVINYLIIEANKDEKYTINFIFTSVNNKKLTKLILTNDFESDYGNEIECTDITKDGKNYVVKYEVENIEESIAYRALKWENGDTSNYFTIKGSNTYIRGVYFVIKDNE